MQQQKQFDYAAAAVRRWPRAVEVGGVGRYAAHFLCDGHDVVRLHESLADAFAESQANNGTFFDLSWYKGEPAPKFVRKPHWYREAFSE